MLYLAFCAALLLMSPIIRHFLKSRTDLTEGLGIDEGHEDPPAGAGSGGIGGGFGF